MKTENCDLGRYYVRTYSELYEKINRDLKEMKLQEDVLLKTILKKKTKYVYQSILSELRNISRVLSAIEECGEYYTELYRAYMNEDIGLLRETVRKRIKQARILYSEIMRDIDKINESQTTALTRCFRSGLGRILSLYKRINRRVSKLKYYLREVSKMPDIRGDYLVVLAGLPQVGKSTILSRLTNAKPKIGTCPFTTKTLIAGHIDVDYKGRIVLVDSPGILDSPIEDKNVIEYKSVLAIKHLADHVLYVFAVYPDFYYTLEEQLGVYKTVSELLGDREITVVLNKIDLLSSSDLGEIVEKIKAHTGREPIPISALTGLNLDKLRETLVKAFTERNQHR